MTEFSWTDGSTGVLNVSGAALEFACYGPDPSETSTIVMLHEGLGSVRLWRDFPQKIAERTGHGVFVYSRAGHGQSDLAELPRPLDYMTLEATDTLPGVLSRIDFRSGILLGHSDGATISAIYAGSIVDHRIRGLILMAPHFFTEPEGLCAIKRAKNAFDTGDLKAKMSRYHRDAENTFRGWNDAWLDPNFEDWNVADVIDYLRIPVLAIQGRDDEYGTLAQIDEIESRLYSPCEVSILDDCGHAPHFDQPEKTLAAISEFATRLRRIENEAVKIA